MGTVGQTVIIPASIPHDYSADVYAQVQPYLDNAPAGAEVRFQENGLYRCERKLQIKKPLDVNGNGSTFKRTIDRPYGAALINTANWRANRECGNWELFGTACTGARLRDMTMIGANEAAGMTDAAYVAALEAQHSVTVQGAVDFELSGLRFFKPFGDFIAILTGTGGRRPTDGYCHDFFGDGNGRQGISVSTGSDMRFETYEIKNMRRAVYDIELDTNQSLVERITFGGPNADDVEIGPHRLNFYSSSDTTLGELGAVTIRNHQAVAGVVLQIWANAGDSSHKRGPYSILNNHATAPYGTPSGGLFTFAHIRGLTVRGNVHPLKTGGVWPDGHMCGVQASDCVIDDVGGNTFAGGVELCQS